MPLTASLTDELVLVLAVETVSSDGRVGLAFVQAVALASSASALQVVNNFSFMCSYRGLEIAKTPSRLFSATKAGRPVDGVEGVRGYGSEISSSSFTVCLWEWDSTIYAR
jgi:hypothetical protein